MNPMEIFFESPLYQKAEEIDGTLKSISALIPENKVMLLFVNGLIQKASSRITQNLIRAEESKRYDTKMYCAGLIRSGCLDVVGLGKELQKRGFRDGKYFAIVERQVEEFRLLFLDWVSDFDQKQFVTDRWGLFNPPGISKDYVQNPDDISHLLAEDEDDNDDDDFIDQFLNNDDN